MLKVLIVDDELLARLALRTAIAWEEHGFVVVAEAEDGLTGFQFVTQYRPDIVLTDISMPGMNGVELIKKTKELYPDTELIILSCHNDFEYVKEGLRSGAADYILKLSMSMEELLKELLQLKEKILKKQIAADSSAVGKETEKWPGILFSLITAEGAAVKSAMEEGAQSGLLEDGAYAILAVLAVDSEDGEVPNYHQSTMIEHLAGAVMARYRVGNYIPFERNRGALLCQARERKEAGEKIDSIRNMMEELVGLIYNYYGVYASAGISLAGELADLKTCYRQAYEALSYKFYTGPGGVHIFANRPEGVQRGTDAAFKVLMKAVDAFDLETIKEKTGMWLDETAACRYPDPGTVKKDIHELLLRMDGDVLITGEGKSDAFPVERAYHQIQKQIYLQDMRHTLEAFFQEAVRSSERNARREIIQARNYVSRHYTGNIRLSDVAEHVNMNVDYFSHLFKKETGSSFIDYLNEFRIEKAKQLLLSGRYKVYEAAFAVGFQDENYFIKRFKKQTGYTPLEFMRS